MLSSRACHSSALISLYPFALGPPPCPVDGPQRRPMEDLGGGEGSRRSSGNGVCTILANWRPETVMRRGASFGTGTPVVLGGVGVYSDAWEVHSGGGLFHGRSGHDTAHEGAGSLPVPL